jgi:hypothetical protein
MKGTDFSIQAARIGSTLNYGSGSEKAGADGRQDFNTVSDSRRYSQASTESAVHEAKLATVLNSHSTDVSDVVMGNQGIESDRQPTENITFTDSGAILYNSIESIMRKCYYEYSSRQIPHENETRFVKCLQQEALREMQSILNYIGSSGRLRSHENGDYRARKMDQSTDIDRTSRGVNLRVKLMSGLYLLLSDNLRVGMELDERDITRLEGELLQLQY